VDAFGRHGFVCKKAPGRSILHHALNDLVARALSAAGFPSSKEPRKHRAFADPTENDLVGLL